MTIEFGQRAIDLGIVISDSDASLAFYRDLLGMHHEADIPMPVGPGGTMHRLRCGDTLIKLVKFDTVPEQRPGGGGISGATGYRYFSIHMKNLESVFAAAVAAGAVVSVPLTEVRPGVLIAIVEDPDGNLVEFIQMS